jgi:hypothetical protein
MTRLHLYYVTPTKQKSQNQHLALAHETHKARRRHERRRGEEGRRRRRSGRDGRTRCTIPDRTPSSSLFSTHSLLPPTCSVCTDRRNSCMEGRKSRKEDGERGRTGRGWRGITDTLPDPPHSPSTLLHASILVDQRMTTNLRRFGNVAQGTVVQQRRWQRVGRKERGG